MVYSNEKGTQELAVPTCPDKTVLTVLLLPS